MMLYEATKGLSEEELMNYFGVSKIAAKKGYLIDKYNKRRR